MKDFLCGKLRCWVGSATLQTSLVLILLLLKIALSASTGRQDWLRYGAVALAVVAGALIIARMVMCVLTERQVRLPQRRPTVGDYWRLFLVVWLGYGIIISTGAASFVLMTLICVPLAVVLIVAALADSIGTKSLSNHCIGLSVFAVVLIGWQFDGFLKYYGVKLPGHPLEMPSYHTVCVAEFRSSLSSSVSLGLAEIEVSSHLESEDGTVMSRFDLPYSRTFGVRTIRVRRVKMFSQWEEVAGMGAIIKAGEFETIPVNTDTKRTVRIGGNLSGDSIKMPNVGSSGEQGNRRRHLTWKEITDREEFRSAKPAVQQEIYRIWIDTDVAEEEKDNPYRDYILDELRRTPMDTGQGLISSHINLMIRGALALFGQSSQDVQDWVPVNPIYDNSTGAKVFHTFGQLLLVLLPVFGVWFAVRLRNRAKGPPPNEGASVDRETPLVQGNGGDGANRSVETGE